MPLLSVPPHVASTAEIRKRGGEVWEYRVEGVTSEDDRLTVDWTTADRPLGMAESPVFEAK
jgi:hypothetical protein